MRLIKLSRGKRALVDDDDYDRWGGYKWYAYYQCKNYYARRHGNGRSNGQLWYLSRKIMGLPDRYDGLLVDHINGNGLDNRKDNLRVTDTLHNMQNIRRPKGRNKTSKYRGVYFNKQFQAYHARITINKKRIHLGFYKLELDAARATNICMMGNRSEFVCFNKIHEINPYSGIEYAREV